MNIDILINKKKLLKKDYIPNDLIIMDNNENNFHKYLDSDLKPMISKKILPFLKKMQQDALRENINLIVDSGYRSYEYQQLIWNNSIKNRGLEETEKWIAMPGSSEHQTGFAIDVAFFRNTKYYDKIKETDYEIIWLMNNSYKYGFILRYPKNKEKITGVNFEPWHYRFVGVTLAKKLYKDKITLEEYYKKFD